jgi:hypothetical protein
VSYHAGDNRYASIIFDVLADANTIGSISGESNSMELLGCVPISHPSAIASVEWGCAVQIAAAAAIESGEKYSATTAQILYVLASPLHAPF